MRYAALILTVALCAGTAMAQTAPSFAGKWTLVPDPSNQSPMGGGLGTEATIVQDGTTLTITRTTQMGEMKAAYKLDGSESKNTFNMGGNSIDQVSKVKVEGPKVTINTTMNFGGQTAETVLSMWLDASGNLMVESTRPDFQGGGQPVTTKSTYK